MQTELQDTPRKGINHTYISLVLVGFIVGVIATELPMLQAFIVPFIGLSIFYIMEIS